LNLKLAKQLAFYKSYVDFPLYAIHQQKVDGKIEFFTMHGEVVTQKIFENSEKIVSLPFNRS